MQRRLEAEVLDGEGERRAAQGERDARPSAGVADGDEILRFGAEPRDLPRARRTHHAIVEDDAAVAQHEAAQREMRRLLLGGRRRRREAGQDVRDVQLVRAHAHDAHPRAAQLHGIEVEAAAQQRPETELHVETLEAGQRRPGTIGHPHAGQAEPPREQVQPQLADRHLTPDGRPDLGDGDPTRHGRQRGENHGNQRDQGDAKDDPGPRTPEPAHRATAPSIRRTSCRGSGVVIPRLRKASISSS